MRFTQVTCRRHNGVFKVPVRRGRKPVKCSEDNKCVRHPDYVSPALIDSEPAKPKSVLTDSNGQWTGELPKLSKRRRELRTSVQKPAEVTISMNKWVPLAKAAKEHLETQGWHNIRGRVYREAVDQYAEVTASRGEEHILMVWRNGILIDQKYHMWANGHTPEKNNRPKSQLDFDMDEVTDRELVQLLSGQKVTWWNRLGTSQESGTVANKVTITHTFIGGTADENPGERVITFVDHGGGGYRSFHASALIKVG